MTTVILGTEFSPRRLAKRDFLVGKEGEREYWLAFVPTDSCGNTLGWYFTAYGSDLHRAGTDSRVLGVWYGTPEDALSAARAVTR